MSFSVILWLSEALGLRIWDYMRDLHGSGISVSVIAVSVVSQAWSLLLPFLSLCDFTSKGL